jgi:hypothetical protein
MQEGGIAGRWWSGASPRQKCKTVPEKELRSEKRLGAWLKWWSACLGNTRPLLQSPELPERKKKRKKRK